MVNYLIKLGWSYKEQELFSVDELIKYFDIKDVNSSAAKFSQELLDFYNNHYLKKFKLEGLYEYINENFSLSEKFINNNKKTEIIDLLREGSNNISELVDELTFFYEDPYLTDEIINAIQIDKNLLSLFKEELKS